eukprot:2942927-Amphidinium_carterae.1
MHKCTHAHTHTHRCQDPSKSFCTERRSCVLYRYPSNHLTWVLACSSAASFISIMCIRLAARACGGPDRERGELHRQEGKGAVDFNILCHQDHGQGRSARHVV